VVLLLLRLLLLRLLLLLLLLLLLEVVVDDVALLPALHFVNIPQRGWGDNLYFEGTGREVGRIGGRGRGEGGGGGKPLSHKGGGAFLDAQSINDFVGVAGVF